MHNRYRSSLVALTLLALSTLAPPVAAQDAPTDPAQQAADAARQSAEAAAPSPRFQPAAPGYVGCTDEPPPSERVSPTTIRVDGSAPEGSNIPRTPGPYGAWLVSAPRGWPGPMHPGEPATLTLTDKFWAPSTGLRWVRATVTGPDGQSFTIPNVLGRDASVVYPDNAPKAPPTAPGVYTVVWTRSADGAFIACDGFVVEPT